MFRIIKLIVAHARKCHNIGLLMFRVYILYQKIILFCYNINIHIHNYTSTNGKWYLHDTSSTILEGCDKYSYLVILDFLVYSYIKISTIVFLVFVSEVIPGGLFPTIGIL